MKVGLTLRSSSQHYGYCYQDQALLEKPNLLQGRIALLPVDIISLDPGNISKLILVTQYQFLLRCG